jgi:hypothetical protein
MSRNEPLKLPRYAELCQELGHLTCNLELLQKRIAEIKSEIWALNQAAPFIQAAELRAAAAIVKAQGKENE